MSAFRFLAALRRNTRGAMAVETAIVAPVLATMALGAFDASRILSRQQQLQSAANEASEIILAASGGTGVSSDDLKSIIASSLGLDLKDVTINPKFRCDDSATLVDTQPTAPGCAASKPVFSYVQLVLHEKVTPVWTQFGIGAPIELNIVRTVQVS